MSASNKAREYIFVSDEGDVVVVCARDRIAAQRMVEQSLGRDVAQSDVCLL